MENDEPLKKIVTEAERYDINFVQHFDNLIDRYQSVEQIKEILFENLLNSIRKNANKGKTKYSTYIKINPSLNPPKVYNDMALIQIISKLRTSAHDLKIETGRHRGIKREHRLCTCGCVEDEEHFLLSCELYEDIRRNENIANQSVTDILENEKYLHYIIKTTKKRKEIVN